MNWKLIFQLSLFGLAMAIGTVFVIPSTVEPIFWLLIFIFCAWLIAKKVRGRYFLHGFLTSLMNCVWITAAHVLLFEQYMARHPDEAQMMAQLDFVSPRTLMALTGPVIGIVSGVVLGTFSVIAAKLIPGKRKAA
jgi:hypothetical protein